MLDPRAFFMSRRGRRGALDNFNGGISIADFFEAWAQPQQEKTDAALVAAYGTGFTTYVARRAPNAVLIQGVLAACRAAELADSTIAAAKAALDAAWASIPRGPGIPPVANAEVTAAEAAYQAALLANSTVQSLAASMKSLFAQRRPSAEEADVLDTLRELKRRGISMTP